MDAIIKLGQETLLFSLDRFIKSGLADCLYRSNEILQHCIDLIVDEIEKRCQDVADNTLDQIFKAIYQDIFSKIPEELSQFIKDRFVKEKGKYVLHCVKEFSGTVDRVYFSPDNSVLFVKKLGPFGRGPGMLINAKNGEVVRGFIGVSDVKFSADGSLLFIAYGYQGYPNYKGELINAKDGNLVKDNIHDVIFSPNKNNSLLFVSYLNHEGELINAKTWEVIQRFDNIKRSFESVTKFSPNGSLLFITYSDHSGELVETKQHGEVIKGGFNNVDHVCFAPDNSLLLICYESDNRGGSKGKLIKTKSGVEIKDFNNIGSYAIVFSPNSSLLFVRHADGGGELINAKSGSVIKNDFNSVTHYAPSGIKFSPDSFLLFISLESEHGYGKLIDTKDGKVIKNYVKQIYFFSDNSLYFVHERSFIPGNYQGKLINAKNGTVIKNFGNLDPCWHAISSPDGSLFFINPGIIVHPGGYIERPKGKLIDTKNGKIIQEVPYPVSGACFSPDSSLVFVPVLHSGALLHTGFFEQIIYKYVLRNTFKIYENQQKSMIRKIFARNSVPAAQLKCNLITLLNHPILKTFPQQMKDMESQKITDAIKNIKGAKICSLPLQRHSQSRGLANVLHNLNKSRGVVEQYRC